MKRKTVLTVAAFLLCAAGIAVYAHRPRVEPETPERHRMRAIVPSGLAADGRGAALPEQVAQEDAYILKAPMETGELVISVLNFDFNNNGAEDQVVAFRRGGSENPVSVAFFAFSGRSAGYRRLWELPTAATVPATVSLFTMDLLGDRNNVVVVTGMNARNEHTMTVFRRNPSNDVSRPFDVIADIRIDGSVAVREVQRSLAYQQGIARGQPFAIVAAGRDPESDNILDRIELTYSFHEADGVYVRSSSVRIPGARVEQDRVREILSGRPGVFENFVHDLWYHVAPDGTVDRSQFIFFDPVRREMVFFGEENQQIFSWQHSNTTRQGIFISGYNSTITTMRRRVNVELESMDGIRVTVTDDRRQRIGVPPPWSGSYRRAGAVIRAMAADHAMSPHKDAIFDSPIGRLRFLPNGKYELSAYGAFSGGRYVFFRADGRDLLELRPDRNGAEIFALFDAAGGNPDDRLVFHVSGVARNPQGRPDSAPAYMGLTRVRIGASGVRDLHETAIVLTRAE